MPVSASTQATIQQTLNNFWQEYALQHKPQGEKKDSDSDLKSESINPKTNEAEINSQVKATTHPELETKILYPGIPEGLVITPVSSKSIKLSWNPAIYAATYNVYRSTKHDQGYRKITNVKSTLFVDTGLNPGTAYFYKISSVKSTGVESYFANPVGTVTNAIDSTVSSIPSR